MMIIIVGIVFLLACFIFYRFYYRPKSEIAKQIATFKRLGYTVYEIPFAFLGLSFMNQWKKGENLHKEAFYFQRTVYPHVDIAIGNVLDKVVIFLVKASLIKEFFSAENVYKYPKYERLIEGLKQPIGVGITFSQGQMWKNKRKLMSKVFNFDLIKGNTQKIGEICDRCYDACDKAHQIGENTFKYDPLELSSKIFNGVIMKCFFGSDLVQEKINGQTFEQFIVQFTILAAQVALSPIMGMFGKHAWNLGLTSNIRLLKRNTHLLRQKSRQIIKKRIEQIMNSPRTERQSDIIQALVHEKLVNKQEFSYSDEDIIAQFLSFLLAGTDTTANFYKVIIFLLGNYPQVHQKLRAQVESIIKSEKDITYENLKKITYLEWIQNQTTRFRGTAPIQFFRIATEDNFIGDIPIKKGTILNYNAMGNYFNPKYFTNPEEFRPERWQKECENIDPYAFIGFSVGARGCIGKHLAYLESKIAIVKLIKRYKTIEVPKEITMKVGLVYEAQHFDAIYSK